MVDDDAKQDRLDHAAEHKVAPLVDGTAKAGHHVERGDSDIQHSVDPSRQHQAQIHHQAWNDDEERHREEERLRDVEASQRVVGKVAADVRPIEREEINVSKDEQHCDPQSRYSQPHIDRLFGTLIAIKRGQFVR